MAAYRCTHAFHRMALVSSLPLLMNCKGQRRVLEKRDTPIAAAVEVQYANFDLSYCFGC